MDGIFLWYSSAIFLLLQMFISGKHSNIESPVLIVPLVEVTLEFPMAA